MGAGGDMDNNSDDKSDDKSDGKSDENLASRREAIKRISIAVGGVAVAIALPSNWTKPVMDAVIGPVGAQFVSFCGPDGTLNRPHRPSLAPGAQGNSCPVPTTPVPTTS